MTSSTFIKAAIKDTTLGMMIIKKIIHVVKGSQMLEEANESHLRNAYPKPKPDLKPTPKKLKQWIEIDYEDVHLINI